MVGSVVEVSFVPSVIALLERREARAREELEAWQELLGEAQEQVAAHQARWECARIGREEVLRALAEEAEGTERTALAAMRDVLGESGRILVGFHLQDPPSHARVCTRAEFEADLHAVGLRVDLRAGSYELHPANDTYGVWILSRAQG